MSRNSTRRLAYSGSNDDDVEPLVGRDDLKWSLPILVMVPMAILCTIVAVDRPNWSQVLSLEATILIYAISPTFFARWVKWHARRSSISGTEQDEHQK